MSNEERIAMLEQELLRFKVQLQVLETYLATVPTLEKEPLLGPTILPAYRQDCEEALRRIAQ